MQQEPHLNELLNIPNRDHVLQMAQTPDVPVYDDEGNKMGKVSKRREDGMLVIHRNKLAAEHELVVPLATIAGADDKAIYLFYHQDELAGYHKAGMHHEEAMTTGSSLAEKIRPPLAMIMPLVRREGIKDQGDNTGHHPDYQ